MDNASLVELFIYGGPVMWPLLGASILGLVPPPLLVAPPLLETPLVDDWLLLAGAGPLTGAEVVELGKAVPVPPAAESANAAAAPATGAPALTMMLPNCSGVLSRPRIPVSSSTTTTAALPAVICSAPP